MVVLLILVLVIAVPVAEGFRKSREQRHTDRRHFLGFAGFTAALVAVVATAINFTAAIAWFKSPNLPYFHPTRQGFLFISASIGMISSAAAFLAGLFSNGVRRVALVIFGPVMGLLYVLAALSNFGG